MQAWIQVGSPDNFVARCLDQLGPGKGRRAFDVAAGTGRHSIELAKRGWTTTAWDVSPVALDIVTAHAAAANVRVQCTTVDLSGALPAVESPPELFVVCDYLDRALLTRLAEALSPDGHLIATTFTVDWPEPHPSARFRLERGELETTVPGLVLEQTEERVGRAGILARPAR